MSARAVNPITKGTLASLRRQLKATGFMTASLMRSSGMLKNQASKMVVAKRSMLEQRVERLSISKKAENKRTLHSL